MADNTLDVRIKQKYDTEDNWNSKNPVLLQGEIAISSDKNNMLKVGNGTSTWSQLSYNKANTANSATTATQLTTSAGSATQPVYFSDGKPVATTYSLGKSVPSNAVFTDTTYSTATESQDGLFTSTEKVKLSSIEEGANKTIVDSSLSVSSTNPVQNKVVNTAIQDLSNQKADVSKGTLFVVGTQTASTGAWTGNLSGVDALFDGLTIDYWLPYSGVSGVSTLNLTLDDGTTTGAKSVYINTTTLVGNSFAANNMMRLTYRSSVTISGTTYEGWWVSKAQNTQDVSSLRYENSKVYAGTNGIWNYSLIALDNNNQWQSFVTSGGTGTSKTINTGAKFRLEPCILFYNGNNSTASGNLVSSSYAIYAAKINIDLRYSTNCTTTQFTANSPIYIECTIDENGYFSVTENCITQTFITGMYYIYLGNTYSVQYQLSLSVYHPVYYYDGTNLVDFNHYKLSKKSDIDHTHNYAGASTSGGAANQAIYDSSNQQIDSTYIKSITTSGKNLTYKKGNGSTTTIDTQQNFITLTKAEYDALVSAGTVDDDCYYFITDDANTSPTLIQYITFAASGWTANDDSTIYTQTVTAEQMTSDDEPMIVKAKTYNTGATEAKAYNKAFAILCDGAGETGDGIVNWKCYKKPATDITVGLIKIMA